MQEAAAKGTLPTTIEGIDQFLIQQQLDLALKINQYDDKSKGHNINIKRKPDGKIEFGFTSAGKKGK